ncbi:hypothetical protein T265_02053 [Opisthorchis viverrini]|uniref:Uncharacterized protein n=1 Tax=Opisthorchis viverrini TaxID=6198 RepID=A0A074ZWJ2_OPIVI|nr:hypothetical protein T265_02053 [Opisthorchis viverrini]KER31828.1 hypothetical protein T265_02053 [Opisthorchis viverrini]
MKQRWRFSGSSLNVLGSLHGIKAEVEFRWIKLHYNPVGDGGKRPRFSEKFVDEENMARKKF